MNYRETVIRLQERIPRDFVEPFWRRVHDEWMRLLVDDSTLVDDYVMRTGDASGAFGLKPYFVQPIAQQLRQYLPEGLPPRAGSWRCRPLG